MKKLMTVLISMVCLIALAASALAGSGLVFTKCNFHGGQKLPVYSGPGHEYVRGANGKANVSTDDVVYAAGMENGWALVMYETGAGNGNGSGSVRVGYVDLDQLQYNIKTLKLSELYFNYSKATITRGCTLTDDPALNNRDLAFMAEGTSVTYLASFYMHRSWAYIETWVDGKPVRAFVPEDCVSVN